MVCTVYDVYIQRFVYNTCMVWYGTVRYGTVWYVYMYVSVCVSVRTWVCNGMAWHGMYVCQVYTSVHLPLTPLDLHHRNVWWPYRPSARKADQMFPVVLLFSVSCGCRRLSQPSVFGMPFPLAATKLSPKSTFSWCVVAAFLNRAELKRRKQRSFACNVLHVLDGYCTALVFYNWCCNMRLIALVHILSHVLNQGTVAPWQSWMW